MKKSWNCCWNIKLTVEAFHVWFECTIPTTPDPAVIISTLQPVGETKKNATPTCIDRVEYLDSAGANSRDAHHWRALDNTGLDCMDDIEDIKSMVQKTTWPRLFRNKTGSKDFTISLATYYTPSYYTKESAP